MTRTDEAHPSYREAAPRAVDRGALLLGMSRGTGRFEAAMAAIMGSLGIAVSSIVLNALVEERTPLADFPLHWWAVIALLIAVFVLWAHLVGALVKRSLRGWEQRARVWENGLELCVDGHSSYWPWSEIVHVESMVVTRLAGPSSQETVVHLGSGRTIKLPRAVRGFRDDTDALHDLVLRLWALSRSW